MGEILVIGVMCFLFGAALVFMAWIFNKDIPPEQRVGYFITMKTGARTGRNIGYVVGVLFMMLGLTIFYIGFPV